MRLVLAVDKVKSLFSGVFACVVVALAAAFLSDHYGGPLMLYALLIGIAFNFLSDHPVCIPGIEFASRTILRVGVALLGARITLDQVMSLGTATVGMVITGVGLTIFIGVVLARQLGLSRDLGLLSGGAVAICGASAALALSSVMPKHKNSERDTILIVIGVTSLSTVAMVIYPLLAKALGMDDTAAGIFLGSTIHDVAQVVGAGYMVSDTAGDTSTIVKLLRVALLLPVVIVFMLLLPRTQNAPLKIQTLVPGFLLVFIGIMGLNTLGYLAEGVQSLLSESSRWFLITAIAGLGIKTSLHKLVTVGWGPVILLVLETLFLAAFIVTAMNFLVVAA